LPEVTYIAEKPSLAKVIAEVRGKMLGVKATKSSTHWTVGDEAVTWLFGHMYELWNPDDYDPRWKSWRIDDLPIIPTKWKRAVRGDAAAQVNAVKALLKNSRSAVNAGDPEREGQLLVDELLEELGWDPFAPNVKRFWSQSLTEVEVTKNINGMFPNSEKRNLYIAAFARQKADWLHGLNMTRLYTGLARRSGADVLVSVGRVQTPTLKLVVDRCREIAKFKSVEHFVPTGIFVHANGRFKAKWVIPDDHAGVDHEGRLTDKKVAQSIIEKIAGKTGQISEFETKNVSKGPPQGYSLSALQQECSAKFGLTAQETLDVAQALYEKHKATSYPRTDSRHLPVSILKEQAPTILNSLRSTPGVDRAAQNATPTIRSKIWDDSKVSDHHGIIPTTEFHAGKLNDMSTIERSVFMLIAKNFVSQFYPDQTWKSISAMVKVEGLNFRASGRLPVSQGWRVVYDGETVEDDEDESEENQTLPNMKRGDPATAEKGELSTQTTKPPAFFTDGTLIAAMINIQKFETDPELKKRLKESDGIGTEATRANIIETLIKRKVIERKGSGKVKKIVSTQQGDSVIDALPNEITSPGLTAIWEAQLTKISKGEAEESHFMKVLSDTLHKRIEQGKNSTITIKGKSTARLPGDGELCEVCKKANMTTVEIMKGDHKGKKFLSCLGFRKDDPTSCKNTIWPDRPAATPVPPAKGQGKQCPKCKIGVMDTKKSAKGVIYLSCTNWKRDGTNNCDHREFPEEDKMPGEGVVCESCGKGHMRGITAKSGPNAGKRFLSCSAYPDCKTSIFPDSFNAGGKGGGKGGSSGKPLPGGKPGAAKPGAKPNPFARK
jgi:DNA topoisomerase-3